jgi:hypothetical protein
MPGLISKGAAPEDCFVVDFVLWCSGHEWVEVWYRLAGTCTRLAHARQLIMASNRSQTIAIEN